MTPLLALLACAFAAYLLVHPRVAAGIKVVLLTAPPVAALAWLLVEVYGRQLVAVAVVAVFVLILVALLGLLGHPRPPTWTRVIVFCTVPVTPMTG